HQIALQATTAIVLAGATGDTRGTPYHGALDRLIEIHRDPEADRSARAAALRGLLEVAGTQRPRALSYLRGVATSGDRDAWTALDALGTDASGGTTLTKSSPAEQREALSVLHELYDSKQVKEPVAAQLLQAAAIAHGWEKNL
ncbi:MAG TPA: hypothetical protein VMH39_11750, partial [Gemmatimonadaceae bacterium]|nr:hypothetical protein [Gemmatimonadaceae bacterium]